MRRAERHPKLTPLRALTLMLDVQRVIGELDAGATGRTGASMLRQVRDELEQHVRAGLVKARRRRPSR